MKNLLKMIQNQKVDQLHITKFRYKVLFFIFDYGLFIRSQKERKRESYEERVIQNAVHQYT